MTSVDVTLCTFRRPMVRDTLASLGRLDLPVGVSLRIIVADNDEDPSAKPVVAEAAADLAFPVAYVHAPARNISIARNAGLDAATADWVAFLDDDEFADPTWLSRLLARASETGADAIFGPAIAEYGPEAPEWMVRQDHHSNRPVRRDGEVETGHTCNALLRWSGTPWQDERFDLARGRSGGEDTEFFFRLRRMGARFEEAEDAIVREAVQPDRLDLNWILRRKYRAGQSHAARAKSGSERLKLAMLAFGKLLACGIGAALSILSEERRNFWTLRGAMHLGVISGCLRMRQPEIYGH